MPNKYECHSVQRQKKLFFKTELHKNLFSNLCIWILLRRDSQLVEVFPHLMMRYIDCADYEIFAIFASV